MRPLILIFLSLVLGCTPKDPMSDWQNKEIAELLNEDRANKELEIVYLNEIREAMENDDQDAFEFYFKEYIEVPRLEIPEELKSHPNYFIGGDRLKY